MTGDATRQGRRAELRDLIDSFGLHPAFVYDRHLTVVESNSLAAQVATGFAVGSNLARFTFLPETADTSVADWDAKRDQVAGLLRESLRRHLEDAEYLDLVGELAAQSHDFAAAWAAEPDSHPTGEFLFTHAAAGVYRLVYHLFPLAGADANTLVLWNAADETASHALQVIADAGQAMR